MGCDTLIRGNLINNTELDAVPQCNICIHDKSGVLRVSLIYNQGLKLYYSSME